MTAHDPIARCASCDGYGWVADEADPFDDEPAAEPSATGPATSECRWCGGIGYVLQDARGVARRIPEADLPALAEALEVLELARLREIGYTGAAKDPRLQAIRLARGDSLTKPN